MQCISASYCTILQFNMKMSTSKRKSLLVEENNLQAKSKDHFGQ